MKRNVFLRLMILFALTISGSGTVFAQLPKFRHIASEAETAVTQPTVTPEYRDSVRSLQEILESLPEIKPEIANFNYFRVPWTFYGYRHLRKKDPFALDSLVYTGPIEILAEESAELATDSIDKPVFEGMAEIEASPQLTVFKESPVPEWLRYVIDMRVREEDAIHYYMVTNPQTIDYINWELPEAMRLADDDTSLSWFIRNQVLPEPEVDGTELIEIEQKRIIWLHKMQYALQFSQAYLSPNWYQGGNNHLALLVNLFWNVQLNQAFYPNLLFENTLSYKLGMNSTPQDKYHKYSISEDLFQWNLRAGFKAFKKWFYSFTLQFKTQFLNNYGSDSEVRKASFLSPADLNIGLGMTYSTVNTKKTFALGASISPISYNLKACLDSHVDPTQFSIPVGKKTASQIGSSGELTIDWTLARNINYKSRVFLFTDYHYFMGDWENTLSFSINRFLSTQLYCRLRYDSSADPAKGWKRWMLKEILSFGFSYAFSSK